MQKSMQGALNETVQADLVKRIGDIHQLKLEPGDTLAIRMPSYWTPKELSHASKVLKRVLPAGVYVFFYHENNQLEFSIIKRDRVEAGE